MTVDVYLRMVADKMKTAYEARQADELIRLIDATVQVLLKTKIKVQLTLEHGDGEVIDVKPN